MNRNIEINGNMDLGAYSPLELTEGDVNESLKEKAVSKAQQRFFGMVDAYKKGEMPDASPAIKKAADGMTKKQVKDFAKTKHKGLPNHVDENTLVRLIRESIQEHLVDVMKRYTEGKATSEEANKAIMDLANSSNNINEDIDERNNRSFLRYASDYYDKKGEKLPDEVIRGVEKKNDERFHERRKVDGKYTYVPQSKKYIEGKNKRWSNPKPFVLYGKQD